MRPSLTPMAPVPHHPKVPDITEANYMKRWAFAKVAEESQDGSASTEVVGAAVHDGSASTDGSAGTEVVGAEVVGAALESRE